jgi:ribosomal protein S18 acetylase RimI-like enzyme
MKFVQASPADVDALLPVYQAAVRRMKEFGISQWSSEYPNEEILQSDAEQGTLFALEADGQFVGAVVLNHDEDPEYQTIAWEDTMGKSAVIHRFVVNPAAQGQGVGRELLRHAEEYARAQGYTSIRIDTKSDNPIAIHVYQSNGYRICGEVFMYGSELPFVCFEKLLEANMNK